MDVRAGCISVCARARVCVCVKVCVAPCFLSAGIRGTSSARGNDEDALEIYHSDLVD